jgi:hypothetical protein
MCSQAGNPKNDGLIKKREWSDMIRSTKRSNSEFQERLFNNNAPVETEEMIGI